ncbi:MAG: TIGR00341 family protein [Thiohalocapsa sp.]
MPVRVIEVFAPRDHADRIAAIAEQYEALDFRADRPADDGSRNYRILARPENQQELIDRLQGALGKGNPWRITIIPVDATIPELEQPAEERRSPEQATREELYAEIERGARVDSTFLQLVVLSTVVAAIGLLENSVAIVIAAMLIAPLLGPNLAMAFGCTLGDRELVVRAAAANAVGITLSVMGAALAGVLLPADGHSGELLARTRLGYDNILLALAAGAAAALSLTTRLPATLTGVAVAVALLPPAAAAGYMLGTAQLRLAAGAAALLTINIVCVNLAAQLVFLAKGIKPRTWLQRRAAKESVRISLTVTGALLAVLLAIMYWRQQ